jgi:hypothetical protein
VNEPLTQYQLDMMDSENTAGCEAREAVRARLAQLETELRAERALRQVRGDADAMAASILQQERNEHGRTRQQLAQALADIEATRQSPLGKVWVETREKMHAQRRYIKECRRVLRSGLTVDNIKAVLDAWDERNDEPTT